MTLDTYPNGTLTPVVGTGFVVVYAGQDYIVTNYHAVDGYNIQVNRDGRGRVKGAPSSRNEVEDQAPLGRSNKLQDYSDAFESYRAHECRMSTKLFRGRYVIR